jgi:hypothetical protein
MLNGVFFKFGTKVHNKNIFFLRMDWQIRTIPFKSPSKLLNFQKTDRVAVIKEKSPLQAGFSLIIRDDDAGVLRLAC